MKRIKSFIEKRSFLFKMRCISGLFILILALVFLYLKIVPFGTITYTRTWPRGLASGKGFIYDFKPAERFNTSSSSGLRLIADPVYFSLFAPRTFNSAEVTIKYVDKLGPATPIVEVGVLRDKLTGQYELEPIQNDHIDKYRFSLARLEDKPGRLVLQTGQYYNNSADFDKDLLAGNLKECPGGIPSCVATYNYPLNPVFRLPDYISIAPTVINQPLRGAHQFYVYFAAAWRLAFDFVDLNLDKEQDPITVNVYSGDKVVATQTLADNNQAPDNSQSEEKNLVLSGQKAPGLYRVEIKVSDDIVMAKLNSSSDRISFINKIWPVSGTGKLTLYTDVPYIGVSTINPASLGEVYFGERNYNLDQTYRQFSFSGTMGTNKIVLNHDDLVLENSGVFTFSAATLINPGAKKVDRYFSVSDSVKYIIADYERPLEDNVIKTSHATLDLKNAVNEKNKYTFLISIPGLDGARSDENYLEIKEITIKLKGRTIFEKLGEIFKK